MNYVRRIAGAMALAGILAAGWFSIRLARADGELRKGTPEGVARAAELAPLNTAYLMLQALQTEYAGGDAEGLLQKIARIAPDASAPRIRLGIEAEGRGDTESAERWLLDAARVDHQFEPSWTLANFYFRQQKMDQFWNWMRAALEVSYGSRDAAFDLCWRAAPDGAVILARAIPERHPVLAAFVAYQVFQERGDAAAAAMELSRARDVNDIPVLDTEMDRLMGAGRWAEAREIWTNMGYPAPTTGGNLIFHPDFETPRVGHGFDWRIEENPGAKFTFLDTPAALRISFDGTEPESCALIEEYVRVRKGKRYVLRWESRGAASGIAWHLGMVSAALGGPMRQGEGWKQGELRFEAERDGESIELKYARPLGEARLEGSIELREIDLEEQR